MIKITEQSFNRVRNKQDFLKTEFQQQFGFLDFKKYENYLSEDFYQYRNDIQKSCADQSALLLETNKEHLIYVDFIDSLNVNAFAKTIGSNSYIGINIGVWIKLKLLFDQLYTKLFDLTSEELINFENIFDSKVQNENSFITHAFISKEDSSVYELEDLKIKINDPDIEKMSIRCTIICLEYILTHEFVHIVQGHTRIVEYKEWGINCLSAVILEQKNKIPRIFEKKEMINAMELQADILAANMLGTGFVRGLLFTQKTKENITKLMWQFSLSLTALFCAFDFSANSVSSYNMSLHPHPGVRLANFFNGLEASVTNFHSSYLQHWLGAQQLSFLCIKKLGLNVRIFNESFNSEKGIEILKNYEKYTVELNALKKDYVITDYIQ